VVKVLLVAGASADASTSKGCTPLMQAAMNGHTSCLRELLENGCNVNAVESAGMTALMLASTFNHHACVRVLMREGGADASIATTHPSFAGTTPLRAATAEGADAKTVRQLMRVCGVCGKTKGDISSCTRCRSAWYCGRTCQTVDWPKHQLVCEKMAAAKAAAKVAAKAAAKKGGSGGDDKERK
jgi:hypothetical protein